MLHAKFLTSDISVFIFFPKCIGIIINTEPSVYHQVYTANGGFTENQNPYRWVWDHGQQAWEKLYIILPNQFAIQRISMTVDCGPSIANPRQFRLGRLSKLPLRLSESIPFAPSDWDGPGRDGWICVTDLKMRRHRRWWLWLVIIIYTFLMRWGNFRP